jgi:hypothetical protein
MATPSTTQAHAHRLALPALAVVVVIAASTFGAWGSPAAFGADPTVTTGVPQACPVSVPSRVAPVSSSQPATATLVSTGTRTRIRHAIEKLPLSFITNVGQIDSRYRFYAQGEGFAYSFTAAEAVLSFRRRDREQTVRLRPVDPGAASTLEARGRRAETFNYFVGSSQYTNLAAHHEIAYEELWPGIDMVFRGQGSKLKYEFHVSPGADLSKIRLAYEGAGEISLGPRGSLAIDTALGTLSDSRPRSYQQLDDERVAIGSRYVLDHATNTFGFSLDEYDRERVLVIDPGPAYSTHLGGTSNDFGIDVAVDRRGNAYVTGQTISSDFPTSVGAFDGVHGGVADAFVVKIDRSGSKLLYATYLGGSGAEAGLSIAVDDAGRAYVSGGTASSDFPTTPGAFDTTHDAYEDVWVAKLNAKGTALIYSTILSGSQIAGDFGAEIAVDDDGYAYVAGGSGSPDFPTTPGSFDPSHNGEVNSLDAFVAKIEPDGSALAWSTKLGGTCNDAITGIAVDDDQHVYVTGSTVSADFPVTEDAYQTRYAGEEDAFVAKLDADGAGLLYSTYLGGTAFDKAQALGIDDAGRAYVTGWTSSSDYPTTRRVPVARYGGVEDAFVTALDATGESLVYSTYLGGAAADRGHGIAVDAEGNAYVTGQTASSDFPTRRARAAALSGDDDAFATKVDASGSRFDYSTYLGGSALDWGRAIAIDEERNAYVTGRTESADFPSSAGAPGATLAGSRDAFVTKLDRRGR